MEEGREKKEFYIVATPIGNLSDISFRAIQILKEVDVILCEDTRVTRKLLSHYHIEDKKLVSYHAHSTKAKENEIIEHVRRGIRYALVSDAGTPSISDPGVRIIQRLYEEFGETIDIIPIPGPSAVIAALSVSGFSGNQFTFYGFFPQKKGRKTLLEEIFQSKRISVFYESTHRILKLFSFIQEHFSHEYEHCNIFVARELTKMFEEKKRGKVKDVHHYFKEHKGSIRGEFVIIIHPHDC